MEDERNLDRAIPLGGTADTETIKQYFGDRDIRVAEGRVFDGGGGGEILGHIRNEEGRQELQLTPRGREVVDRGAAGWT